MKSSRSKQRLREQREKISTLLTILSLVAIGGCFLIGVFQRVVTIEHYSNNCLQEYTGEFSYNIHHGLRNYSYYFCLGNGDALEVSNNYVIDYIHDENNMTDLSKQEVLCFQYSNNNSIWNGKYYAISISSPVNKSTYVDEYEVIKDMKLEVALFAILGCSCLFLGFILCAISRKSLFSAVWK